MTNKALDSGYYTEGNNIYGKVYDIGYADGLSNQPSVSATSTYVHHVHSLTQTDYSEENNNISLTSVTYMPEINDTETITGCYNIPKYHVHTGSDLTGTGCYTSYQTHAHTFANCQQCRGFITGYKFYLVQSVRIGNDAHCTMEHRYQNGGDYYTASCSFSQYTNGKTVELTYDNASHKVIIDSDIINQFSGNVKINSECVRLSSISTEYYGYVQGNTVYSEVVDERAPYACARCGDRGTLYDSGYYSGYRMGYYATSICNACGYPVYGYLNCAALCDVDHKVFYGSFSSYSNHFTMSPGACVWQSQVNQYDDQSFNLYVFAVCSNNHQHFVDTFSMKDYRYRYLRDTNSAITMLQEKCDTYVNENTYRVVPNSIRCPLHHRAMAYRYYTVPSPVPTDFYNTIYYIGTGGNADQVARTYSTQYNCNKEAGVKYYELGCGKTEGTDIDGYIPGCGFINGQVTDIHISLTQ